jgi:hypothetical protein
MFIIIITIIVLAIILMIFNQQAKNFASAICTLLVEAISEGERFFVMILRQIIKWLTQAETPKPLPTLVGIIVFGIAVAATVANFVVVLKSVSVIFPWEVAGRFVAFGLVSLTGLMGFLFHSIPSRLARFLTLIAAAMLIFVLGSLAYIRTVEQKKVEHFWAQEQENAISGELTIDGQETLSTQEPIEAPKESHQSFDFAVLLAPGTAVLVAVAEVIAYWGSFKIAGSALVWLFSSPVLLLFALPATLFHLLNRSQIAKALTGITNAVIEAMGRIGEVLRKTAVYFTPSALRERKFKRETEFMQKAAELERLQTEQDAERDYRHHQRQESIKYNKLVSELSDEQWAILIKCFTIVRDSVEKVYRDISQKVSKELVEQSLAQSRKQLNLAAEHVISGYVLPNISEFLQSVDGKHLLKSLSEKRNKNQEGIYNEV